MKTGAAKGMFPDFEGPQEQWAYFSRMAYLKRFG